MDNEGLFVTIYHPQYRKAFKKALDDIIFFVPLPYTSVTPSGSIFRKPFSSWLKESVLGYYDDHQLDIFDLLNLSPDTPANLLAWYCTLLTSYGLLKNSPSCSHNGQITYWGEQIESFIHRLCEYGISENIISKADAAFLIADLLGAVPFSEYAKYQSQKRATESSYPSASPPIIKDESEKYADYKLPPLEDNSDSSLPNTSKKSRSSKKENPYKFLGLAGVTLVLLFAFLAVFSDFPETPVASVSTVSSVPTSNERSSSSRTVTSHITPSSTQKPRTGEYRTYDFDVAYVPFEVLAPSECDFYLVLAKDQKAAHCYYIHGGDTLSVHVPLGNYRLYYACAPASSLWYGEKDLWLSNTDFFLSSDSWDFDIEDGYYTGYTLTLKASSNGNTTLKGTSSQAWDSLFS